MGTRLHSSTLSLGRLGVAFAALLTLALPASAAFLHRCDLAVAGIPAGTTLTNFPVLVRLANVTGFDFGQIRTADASDLSFRDAGDNALAWEVDTFNASAGKLLVWVKLPSATTNTTFKAYWGDATPSAHTASDVWAGYVVVWHLNNLNDSTANGYHLTKYNAATTNNADGKLGACYTIAPVGATRGGTHGLVALGTTNATLGTAFTVSGWVRHKGAVSWDHIFYRKNASQDFNGFCSEINNTTLTTMHVYGTNKTSTAVTIPTTADTWVHLALAFNGKPLTVYANGVGSSYNLSAAPSDNGLPLSFGNNWSPTTRAPSDYFWIGEMDELRVYPATASAKWMAAEYATLANSGFLSYGKKVDTAVAATKASVH